MTFRQLEEECGKRKVECKGCPYYGKECEVFSMEIDGASPYSILEMLDKEIVNGVIE